MPYRLPEKPALEGLEAKWTPRWETSRVYAFDRTKSRGDVYAIDTPPPTVSGSLHVGHVFSFTHTDVIARYQRMRGQAGFYPMGWDDNGLPTERRVQNYYGVRCDPSLPYEPGFEPPAEPPKPPLSAPRPTSACGPIPASAASRRARTSPGSTRPPSRRSRRCPSRVPTSSSCATA